MATSGKNLSSYAKDGLPSAKGRRFAVITSQWNAEITQALRTGCVNTLLELGAAEKDIKEVSVPGAVELTYAAARVLRQQSGNFRGLDAIIVIGCVIRGETAHFDYVCQSVTHGVTELNLKGEVPVIFCVLTDDTIDQSLARSGGKHGNKGVEAAVAALQMSQL